MQYKRQYGGKKQKNKKTMLSISYSKTLKRKKCSHRIQSADGNYYTWNKARTIKTKPGQRKRTVNERTQAKRKTL
jgi:phage protein D